MTNDQPQTFQRKIVTSLRLPNQKALKQQVFYLFLAEKAMLKHFNIHTCLFICAVFTFRNSDCQHLSGYFAQASPTPDPFFLTTIKKRRATFEVVDDSKWNHHRD